MAAGLSVLRSIAEPALGDLRGLFMSGPRASAPLQPLMRLARGNQAKALDLYRGTFAWAGSSVSCKPVDVFDIPAPSAQWQDKLLGFDWLDDLRASGLVLHRSLAQAMVSAFKSPRRDAARAKRVLALAAHARFLTEDTGEEFRSLISRLVTREVSRLRHSVGSTPGERLWRAMALHAASFAFRGLEPLRPLAADALLASLDESILPDGGHVSRNPSKLLSVMQHLVPLRYAAQAAHEPVPPFLTTAIERGFPMLRMMRHGDGGLAHVQGAGTLRQAELIDVLEFDQSAGRPMQWAPHSALARLARAETCVIVDGGLGPVCDAPLAFEFSDGESRIVTSCAMPEEGSKAWRQAASRVNAQSTACFELRPQKGRALEQGEVIPGPQGVLFRGAIGCHRREVFLSKEGDDLRGADHLAAGDGDVTLRFHLHPAVKAMQARNGEDVVLLLPDKTAWKFTARNGAVGLEESVYLADSDGPRKTQQITVSLNGHVAKWAFKRLEKIHRAKPSTDGSGELPF